ncbi:MAG: MATE family efflux transporter [Deltaproteobacteria bacterium]|nr:MATE family efflux transporter [Deltaproteobacteria bacterium]
MFKTLSPEVRKAKLAGDDVGSLLRELGVPAILGMFVTAFNNLIDTIFVGQGLGIKAIGGLAIVFPLQMIFLAVAQAIGVGGGAIISIALGNNDQDKVERILGNVLSLVLCFSALFLLIGGVFIVPLMRMFGATDALMPFAVAYTRVTIWGFFFYALSMALSNVVRAEGNTMVAMTARIVAAILKLILTPVFIFIFRWGMEGAALSTVVAHFISLLVIAVYMLGGKSLLKVRGRYLLPDYSIVKQIFSLGSSVLVRYMAGSIVSVLINNTLSYYGQYFYIAMYGIIYRVRTFIFQPIYGLAQGMQPIVGFAVGMRDLERIKKALKLSFFYGTLIAFFSWGLMALFADETISLFGSSEKLIERGDDVLVVANLMLPTVGFQIIAVSMFLSLGRSVQSLMLSIARQALFFIPLAIILPMKYGPWGIWYAYPLSDLLSFLVAFFLVRHQWKMFETAKTQV